MWGRRLTAAKPGVVPASAPISATVASGGVVGHSRPGDAAVTSGPGPATDAGDCHGDDRVARAEWWAESQPVGWRAFRRWSEVLDWVGAVLAHPEWAAAFPNAPLDVEVHRRSRSARFSAAHVGSATVWIRDGSWDSLTVLHELAHLAVGPTMDPHGARFVAAELVLVRRFVGIDAWATLRRAFVDHGVPVPATSDTLSQ